MIYNSNIFGNNANHWILNEILHMGLELFVITFLPGLLKPTFSKLHVAMRNFCVNKAVYPSLCIFKFRTEPSSWLFIHACVSDSNLNFAMTREKIAVVRPWRHRPIGMQYLKALLFLYAFEESVDCHLLSSFFAMIQTCTYLYSSMYFPRWV